MNGGASSSSATPFRRSSRNITGRFRGTTSRRRERHSQGRNAGRHASSCCCNPSSRRGDLGSNNGFQSISGRRQPDIVLTRTDEDVPKWYVLDAKYRTKRPSVLEAMTSAHVYRDALRWYERRPERAVLLVPRGGGAPWLEQPEFISRHRVGVCALGADTTSQSVFQSLFGEDSSGRFRVAHER